MSVPFIPVDEYKFLSLATLERYIGKFEYVNKHFSAKQQALKF